VIGGVVSLVGAVLTYGLVRQRDFVASGVAVAQPARQLRGMQPQPAGETTTRVALSASGGSDQD